MTPTWPDPYSREVRGRAAAAVDVFLDAWTGRGRRRDVAHDLLGELIVHHAEMCVRWGDPEESLTRLETMAHVLAGLGDRPFHRPVGAGATPQALAAVREVVENLALAYPPGPPTLAALSLALTAAALARAGADLGIPAASWMAQCALTAAREAGPRGTGEIPRAVSAP